MTGWPHLSRRQCLATIAAAGLVPARDGSAATVTPRLLQNWHSGSQTLAPLSWLDERLLYCGDTHLGCIDTQHDLPVWCLPHHHRSPAVYRPRTAGPLVVVGGQHELGAWQLSDGQPCWQYQAHRQIGTPCVTPARTFVGDGHELLALNNVSGRIDWRFGTTPGTLAAYAPAVAGELVFYGPGNGLLYALGAADGTLRWTRDHRAEWQYVRQMYVCGQVLVAGTYTEMLYGIAVDTGQILWKFKAGNFINSHHVTADTAYLWSPTGWIYALNIQSGSVRWRHQTTRYNNNAEDWGPLMAELVAFEGKLYCLDMRQVLHVLDLNQGDELLRLPFSDSLRPTVCPRSASQAFVATDRGDIQLVQW